MRESIHRPVLLNEVIEGLNLHEGSVVLDGTLGGGGHSKEICQRYKKTKIIALDQDASVWRAAKENLKDCDVSFHNMNFRDLRNALQEEEIKKVDGIIFDLGLSSDQLENSGRGFSFQKDEPLLMTMKENPRPEDVTAEDVVNDWSEKNLADIIYGYGEERYARRIARVIVEKRKKKRIKTTGELVAIIKEAVPGSYQRTRIHFATRTFQALRIAVNDELGALEGGLKEGFAALKEGGRMAVISFHSLEDRIVKKFYQEKKKEGLAILINKKPITASEKETRENGRARSAKLRIIEKTK